MNNCDRQYIELVNKVLVDGNEREDRTGVGTKSIFGHQMRFNLSEGFPLLTTKKLSFKLIKAELLWFIEGSTDERRLAEITYGKPRGALTDKGTIWTANATAPYWIDNARFVGDLGRVYGAQWRSWQTPYCTTIDQISNVIDSIRNDPSSRRHLVVAYNPGEIKDMALPPCHAMFQFYVADGKLSCQLYQRSVDIALGLPYNIASYALLTHMIAHICDLQVGEFIHTSGDAHVYLNHVDGLIEQSQRNFLSLPVLEINKEIKNINDFKMNDIKLHNYTSHPEIKFPFAV